MARRCTLDRGVEDAGRLGDTSMHDTRGRDGDGAQSTDRRTAGSASRRTFLRATAGATALAAGVGATGAGAAADRGIPTPWLSRNGRWIEDPTGNEVVLRGVNVIDPARAAETAWRRSVSETVKHATDPERGWHSRVIRIPIQPGDVAQDGKGYGSEPDPVAFEQGTLESYLETYLDPVIDTCESLGVYAIVDYHRHRTHDLKYTEDSLHDEVTMFWETVAPRYADRSHVLYEVYNEPISPFVGFRERGVNVDITDPGAEDTWLTWRETAQPWVDTIREHAPRNLVLIGSPSWSQWTWWADEHEFDGDDLAYTGHVYAHPNLRPLGEYFGKPAESVPVFMTEFGWEPDANEYFQGRTTEEGQQFVEFFESYENVHWTVWCFDHIWAPAMFEKPEGGPWNLLSGEKYHGKFFKDYLAEKRSDDLPRPAGATPTDDGTPDPGTPTDAPTPTNGTARDLDGDGLAEDVNGNGESDFGDVTALFDEMDSIENPGQYDFNENGDLDFGDVVALFESL